MKIFFGQIYVEPGVSFPFSHHFQKYMSSKITELVKASPAFLEQYGNDWNVVFRISAKSSIQETEIKGPTRFPKSKDVEFSVFLPFNTIRENSEPNRYALEKLFHAITTVLSELEIDCARVQEKSQSLISNICSNTKMFNQ